MQKDTSFIDDIRDIIENPTTTPVAPVEKAEPKPAETYPCESCGGTGVYRGVRVRQQESRCFACSGRGWFKKSLADRMKARGRSRASKAKKAAQAQAVFDEANPGLIAALSGLASWNNFAASLVEQYSNTGTLTEGQIAAARRTIAKAAERQAERQAAKAAETVAQQAKSGEVDMSAIGSMFERVLANGLKRPRFVAADLMISLAPATGKNAGALYVKRGDAYQGKVVGNKFYAVREARADTITMLNEIAADPGAAARAYGIKTGTCCCCGRELTDPASIAAGIGPVCATKWGI